MTTNYGTISASEIGGDPDDVVRRQIRFQIANGYMGYRGTLDEDGPDKMVGKTLAGVYDQVGDAWREPVNAPNGGFTQVEVNGVKLTLESGRCVQHRQSLNLANAKFSRESEFQIDGIGVTISSTRFLSAANPHLGVIRYGLRCDTEAELAIRTGIDGNIRDLSGTHLPELLCSRNGEVLIVSGNTQEKCIPIAVVEVVPNAPTKQAYELGNRQSLRVWKFIAQAGVNYSFDKFFTVVTGQDQIKKPPLKTACAKAIAAAKAGFESCLQDHSRNWADRWKRADVVIEGDDEAQMALRFSIFQLLMAAPVIGSANSIPARALSGQVYKGAVFWDTEMFMFPMFLYTWPEVAEELMRYRIRTLDGARRKARTEGTGYDGAFYAWESQESGDDACSYFNVGDPNTGRDLRTYFRDKQIHVSGDIAIAMWMHFKVTGCDSLLFEGGAEVILECARFYSSYAYYKKEKKRYEFLDVIGPDEYHERVHNNAFTNAVIRETFRIALEAIEYLEKRNARWTQALLDRLEVRDKLGHFREIYEKIYVPEPDPTSGLIEQFEGYFKLADSSIAAVNSRKIHPNEYLGAGQGLAAATQIIKQADVIMMAYLFRDAYREDIVRANWEYYEPRTEHGSSLSACAYAISAAAIGKLEEAYRYFIKTASIDLEGDFKLYAGTVFMAGTHAAASGGAWLTAVMGFGGVHLVDHRLAICPRLYSRWKRLRFAISHRGGKFDVSITPDTLTVIAAATNPRSQEIFLAGDAVSIAPNEKCSVSLSFATVGEESVDTEDSARFRQ